VEEPCAITNDHAIGTSVSNPGFSLFYTTRNKSFSTTKPRYFEKPGMAAALKY